MMMESSVSDKKNSQNAYFGVYIHPKSEVISCNFDFACGDVIERIIDTNFVYFFITNNSIFIGFPFLHRQNVNQFLSLRKTKEKDT